MNYLGDPRYTVEYFAAELRYTVMVVSSGRDSYTIIERLAGALSDDLMNLGSASTHSSRSDAAVTVLRDMKRRQSEDI